MKSINHLTLLLFLVLTTTIVSAVPSRISDALTFNRQESNLTLIELLQNGESYSIEITSIGCFNGARKTITISKEADSITASYPEFSKILNEQDIESFISFEHELRELDTGGCSTVDTYILRYGDRTFQTSDGTCSWNGGKKLLKEIS